MADYDAAVDAFLLTNNPKWFEFDADLLADWIDATASGEAVEGNWSTGGTKKKIVVGDRAFLLRQGTSHRGIFASGRFTSSVYQEEHWRDPGTLANFADVKWDTFIDPEDALPTERLQFEFPDAEWNPRVSGTQIPASVVGQLETIWREHLLAVRSPTHTPSPGTTAGVGRGRKVDSALRKQIEDLAQQRLMAQRI